MIKNLLHFSDIKFPIVTLEKSLYKDLGETKDKVIFNDTYVLKYGSLLEALSINKTYIPTTTGYYSTQEIFLSNLAEITNYIILDSNFAVFIPLKTIDVKYSSFIKFKETENYIRVNSYSYYFKKLVQSSKSNSFPVISEVQEVAFFVGWTQEHFKASIKL